MIQVTAAEAEVCVQVEVSGTKMNTKIMMIQEIGKVRAEAKAGVMAMEKTMIMEIPAAPIPEGGLVA